MEYNFYIFGLLIAILNASSMFLKKNILKTISITEEMLFSTVLIFISILSYYLIVNGIDNLNKFIDNIISNKNNVTQELFIFDLMVIGVIILAGNILINENIVYGESIKIAIYLILIALVSCVYKNIMNFKILWGVILLILGIFMLESGNKDYN